MFGRLLRAGLVLAGLVGAQQPASANSGSEAWLFGQAAPSGRSRVQYQQRVGESGRQCADVVHLHAEHDQLEQAVIYIDRFPDTVQTDHVDWGMRFSALYGENYRYATAYGIFSNQLLKKNSDNGVDFPMIYGELYFPQVMDGLMLRLGRFISLPDIEAQLALTTTCTRTR